MRIIKFILRRFKRFLVAVFGTRVDELYWRFRHIFDRSWAESYLSGDSDNNFLLEKISEYLPFKNVLEFGCASGLNLYFLAKELPQTEFYGIDISRKAVKEGRKNLERNGIKNVCLNPGGLEALKKIDDRSIDLIFTNAVLIYFGEDKIEAVIKEFLRISKKAVILFEMHHNLKRSAYKDNWIHNYTELFGKYLPKEKIKINKLPKSIGFGEWDEFGHIVEISL